MPGNLLLPARVGNTGLDGPWIHCSAKAAWLPTYLGKKIRKPKVAQDHPIELLPSPSEVWTLG